MLVSGFTIIRNGVKYDFPFIESIKSVLPVCDEFVINIGFSEDETRQTIEHLKFQLPEAESKKIRIIENEWPLKEKTKRNQGQILADQTNLALKECKGTWCFYIQADEVVHEQDLTPLREKMEQLKDRVDIEGLVFEYVHFYGNYNVIQTSRSAYRREIRVIRNGMNIESTGDAQSFRHQDGSKLSAILTRFKIYHYGWVRPQEIMRQKTAFMDTLYHPDATKEQPATGQNYLYKNIVGLRSFEGTHPKVMQERVKNSPNFDFSKAPKVFQVGDTWKVVSGWLERATGHRPFEYKNYKLKKE